MMKRKVRRKKWQQTIAVVGVTWQQHADVVSRRSLSRFKERRQRKMNMPRRYQMLKKRSRHTNALAEGGILQTAKALEADKTANKKIKVVRKELAEGTADAAEDKAPAAKKAETRIPRCGNSQANALD